MVLPPIPPSSPRCHLLSPLDALLVGVPFHVWYPDLNTMCWVWSDQWLVQQDCGPLLWTSDFWLDDLSVLTFPASAQQIWFGLSLLLEYICPVMNVLTFFNLNLHFYIYVCSFHLT